MNRYTTSAEGTVAAHGKRIPSSPKTHPPLAPLPGGGRRRATCAWCSRSFSTIVELLDHVDRGHLVEVALPTAQAVVVRRGSGRHRTSR